MKTTKILSKRADPNYVSVHKDTRKNLDKSIIQVREKDWDRTYIIDGMEGAGKSLLALQLAKYVDPTFNLTRVTFNGIDFSKAIDEADPFQAVVFDEAFNGLASSAATSKMNRFIVRKLMECRQKNLFIFIVLPTFFLLQKYAAIFRSKALFHVYTDKKGNRGRYKIYNYKNKKLLYLNGAKFYNYRVPFINKSQKFSGKYPVDEKKYREKKRESLLQDEEGEKKFDKNVIRFAILLRYLKYVRKETFRGLAQYLNEHNMPINERTLGKISLKTL